MTDWLSTSPELTEHELARFWAKVQIGPGCWLWVANKDKDGYGKITVRNRSVRAPRLSFYIAHGRAPVGLVLHHCDTPSCVRPACLFEGSHLVNQRDMTAKGRGRSGASNGRARLLEADIRTIRSAYGPIGIYRLSNAFGVSPAQIYRIVKYQQWTHVK